MTNLNYITSKNVSPHNRVRHMNISDQGACLNIQRRAFPKLKSYTDFAKEFGKDHSIYLVTYFEQCQVQVQQKIKLSNYLCECSTNATNVSGFIGSWRVADQIQIIDFVVAPEFRRFGIGWLLLASLIEHAGSFRSKLVTLEVRASNDAAINLYKKFGFEICGHRKSYYSNKTEDAILMNLELES
ncbi:MAG: ribosomal-protein-alanine N-acetyltransferase [Dehalococcoidia bacterium]|nr:ribosomal-protein-alanine N-acetyltransferase [Dehalococcoidia bacterium]